MKKVLLLTMIVLNGILFVNAQSRTNKKMLSFEKQSEKLTSASGWKKNEKTGKWIENQNVIDDKKVSSYWISHVSQNFKWLQFRTIVKDEKTYYVFIYERLGGAYKYPSIYEDWESDKRTYYFALSSEKYKEVIEKIELKDGKNIKLTSKINGHISDKYKILGGEHLYNEENLLAKITNTIENPSYSESCLVLNSQTTDGKDILRFRLPESCYFAEKYMKTAYFEVGISEFKKIFIE